MSYIVRMPKLGVEMETGVVLDWRVDVDDAVAEDQVVAEIESEKTTAEITAREGGVLRKIYLEESDEAPPGTPMGIIAAAEEDVSRLEAEAEADGEKISDTDTPGGGTSPSGADQVATQRQPSGESDRSRQTAAEGKDVAPRTPDGRIKATPKARKRAEERGVALREISGSGPDGCIVSSDVEQTGSEGSVETTVREKRPLSEMREAIADRLGRSYREAPHATVNREIDVERAFAAAARADDSSGVDVSITDVILFAVSKTLDDYPEFNATFDGDEEAHVLYTEHNLGIAVDVDGGLLTPVVPDVQEKSPAEIATSRRRLVDRVSNDEYTPDDLSGGTFTVSNLGVFGSDGFTPIINPPEVAILGVGRDRNRAVDTDGGVEFRRHIVFSLSFDHRVVDGADAARFLTTLETHLTDSDSLVERG